jgi:hypothetical protein
MRLCRFEIDGRARQGVVEDDFVVEHDPPDERHALGSVRLLAPVIPRKYLAIGLNYEDHIAESGMQAPDVPFFFNKQVSCVVGPSDDIHMPRVSSLLDYEAELAIVIGKRARHVPVESAHEVMSSGSRSKESARLRTPSSRSQTAISRHTSSSPRRSESERWRAATNPSDGQRRYLALERSQDCVLIRPAMDEFCDRPRVVASRRGWKRSHLRAARSAPKYAPACRS